MSQFKLRVRPESAVCVVIAAKGYPASYTKGDVITFPAIPPAGVTIFHAGTSRRTDGSIVTAGGRVLGVTAIGASLKSAAETAYRACGDVKFNGMYFRRDIGAKQLRRS